LIPSNGGPGVLADIERSFSQQSSVKRTPANRRIDETAPFNGQQQNLNEYYNQYPQRD
jgi:hypothetical protein